MTSAKQQTLLFIDDHHILYRSGTHRTIHPMQRHSTTPIISSTYPWELAIGWMSIYNDPRTGKYQIWYQA